MAVGLPAGATADGPDLRLLWYDPENLLPQGFNAISRNFETMFREVGAAVTLERATGIEGSSERSALRVIAVSRIPSAWKLGSDVLAVAPDPSVRQKSVYVIVPRVRRELGHTGRRGAGTDLLQRQVELGRALPRLIAHELVHAVAPAHPHAKSGLMRARQGRSFLLRQKMHMDPACIEAFRQGLASRARASRYEADPATEGASNLAASAGR